VEEGLRAGLSLDEFVPRLSFFFDIHMDFFEEVAKLRAARRIWARHMRERFKARNPRSWKLRFHAQTAGCSLTEQQPENNIVRTAYEALAAVLGGCQSLHTNSLDETIALPSELAAHIALRTQQVLAHETNVDAVADPLGGSYYVEQLTDRLEEEAEDYFKKIKKLGGVIECIESGFYQKELSESALKFQRELERNEKILVGVNAFQGEEVFKPPVLKIGGEVGETQKRKLKRLRKTRSHAAWARAMNDLKKSSRGKDNLIPKILAAALAYATEGEIADILKEEFGVYEPPSIF
jgi:methylmalonyl-CoA mutase N-terminal domain/subunit